MVGLRRIAGRRADALVLFVDQTIAREVLARGVAPELLAHAFVHALGESFRDAVGQRFDHDRAIIVVGALEPLGDAYLLDAGGNDESPDPIGLAALGGSDEIGQTNIRLAVAL